jgi:hypothetical protein
MARRWGQWLPRIQSEANATSGLFGLAGAGIGIIGGVMAAPVAVAVGSAAVVGTLGWCVIKAIPPKLQRASDVVGTTMTAADVLAIDPPISRAGFVGTGRVGKSTLLSHIAVRAAPAAKTAHVSATVISSQSAPQRYLALFDGAGQQYSQQFKILDSADILLVFVDHNAGDRDIVTDHARLEEHQFFIRQLIDYLTANSIKLRHAHFVLNKSDLWMSGPDTAVLRSWFDGLVTEWGRSNLSASLSHAEHSNTKPSDVTALNSVLFRHVR